MNTSINQNLKAIRNDTFERRITVKEDGIVKDITGWTFFFTIKTNQDDLDAVALVKVDWATHTDPVNGVTLLTVPAASTNFTGEKYYDLQYKDAEGKVKTFLIGKITFDKDVTTRTS